MDRSDYENALEKLTPEIIISNLSSYNDKDIDSVVDRVVRLKHKYPKTKKVILNGIIVYLLMTHNGKLPNDRYIALTHKSFIEEHKLSTAEQILDFIVSRKEYRLKLKEDKKENRSNYYNKVVNVDVSEVFEVTSDVIKDTKNKLDLLSQSKKQ